MSSVQMIPTHLIDPHPRNPRRNVGDITELAESIHAQGIRQPLLIVPHGEGRYRAVIGHRRLAAAEALSLPSVPAAVDHDLSEVQQLELMLVENLQRTDLSPVEEAAGYQDMLDLGATVSDVVRQTGRSETTVRHRLRLLTLPEAAREAVHGGMATLEDAAMLEEFADDQAVLAELSGLLGSSDFRWTVSRERRRRERLAQIAAKVESAERSGAVEWAGDDPGYGDIPGYVIIWADPDEGLPVGTVYVATEDRFILFRPADAEEKARQEEAAASDAASRERYRDLARRERQDREDALTAWQQRDDFVSSLLDRKRFTARERHVIVDTAAIRLATSGVVNGLGRPHDDELVTGDTIQPERILLIWLHQRMDAKPAGWRCMIHGYSENHIAWYECLQALGYQPSTIELNAVKSGVDNLTKTADDDLLDDEED